MKVWFIHADEDEQVCSTKERAKEAFLSLIKKWNDQAEAVLVEEDETEVVYDVKFPSEEDPERFWIYAYEVDGGPIC